MSFAQGAVAHIPRSTRLPSEANARLIAAAPELLSALQLATDWIQEFANGASKPSVDGRLVIHSCNDVLKKARGEA